MDSTLLDQIRHLCRDRAAYEKLKAILVQQESVYQLSWEERYGNLLSQEEANSPASDIFKNIIAREKGLAQLADTIQRSPSLELVLQVAVQVTQKLLQVDRVAIFRRHSDGRSEFITDAIATGINSLAEMPERQLLLAQHMLNATHSDQFTQTIEGIRNGNLSHHLSTLLEQINISSYAANKIYAGHECWGVLVAFHGSVYHVWSESDRTSLSLVAAQIGIAISLMDLRSQSQTLNQDLQKLQLELESLQQTVTAIAQQKSSTAIAIPEGEVDIASEMVVSPDITEKEIPEIEQIEESEEIQKIADLEKIEQVEESITGNLDHGNATGSEVSNDEITKDDSDDINLIPQTDLQEDDTTPQLDRDWQEDDTTPQLAALNQGSQLEKLEKLEELENETDVTDINEAIESEAIEDYELITPDTDELGDDSAVKQLGDQLNDELKDEPDTEAINSEPETSEPEIDPETPKAIATSNSVEEEVAQETELMSEAATPAIQDLSTPVNLETDSSISKAESKAEIDESEIDEDDREPAIEPHFLETILAVAGNDNQGIQFLVDVIDNFLEETPRLVQAIDKAIAVNDHPRLLHVLNRLRISSDYVGALPLAYQCRQLESAVKANYVVLMYACLSQVAIESQRATNAIRIERVRYAMIMDSYRGLL